MRTVVTLLVIFLVQCANLRAEPTLTKETIGEMLGSDSCIFGVKSISILLHNSFSEGKNISKETICTNIDLSKRVVFVVHGFVSSANASSFEKLTLQLKQKGYTVFAVDWSQGACTEGIPIIKFMNYPSAVKNTIEIGQYIASYVKSLIECGVPLKNITFIGHSLGAHISGFAAKEVKKLFNDRNCSIPLIIAADPAWPLFKFKECENRLCQSDADCLKVLHTSTLGMDDLGHLNLKFEGGWMQPGCGPNIACSHASSVVYISDMLKSKNCGFVGVPIESKLSSVKLRKVEAILPPTTMLESFSSSPYPSPDTKNCIFINDNILDSRNCPKKDQKKFHMFVAKDSHCTSETFSCEQ